MPVSFTNYKAGYANLWRKAVITRAANATVIAIAKALTSAQALAQYQEAARATGIPAGLLAAINYRESGGTFTRYLGNGDPLDRPTTNVPAGRGPFQSWIEGAVDAMKDRERPTDGKWSIEFALYFAENFNGRAYAGHNENSPYVWAGTTLEELGLYVRDHQYDPSQWDQRAGVAALFLAYEQIAPSLALPTLAALQEHPTMTTTTPATDDHLQAIIDILDEIKKGLPIIAPILPAPIAIIATVAIPALEDIGTYVEQRRTTPTAPDALSTLLTSFGDRLHALAQALKPTA